MKLKSKFVLFAVAASVCLVNGCATKTTYVPQGSSRLITSVGKINVQDFEQAADEMTKSLLKFIDDGKLRNADPNGPALMAISRIQNSTGQQLETDLLIKK